MMPSAAGPATYSKCAVSPRITQPMPITASYRPVPRHDLRRERHLERAGHPRDVDVVVADAPRSERLGRAAEQAPGDRLVPAGAHDPDALAGAVDRRGVLVRRAEVLAHRVAFAQLVPRPSMPIDVVETVEEVAHLLPLGAQVVDVLRVRGRLAPGPAR